MFKDMIASMVADDLLSDEVKEEILSELNKSIDIPIISEKTERAILEAIWGVVESIIRKKIGV